MDRQRLLLQCQELITAKQGGLLGECIMPEDAHPNFSKDEQEVRLSYFTLPMALNYQRDSYTLWNSALKTYEDRETKLVFDLCEVAKLDEQSLREKLLRYKVALQPNKHITTWHILAKTISSEWGGMEGFLESVANDFLQLRQVVQGTHKKKFPYLSGPKIFNYWSCILQEYGGVQLKNAEYIDIAPDTHIIKCSIRLGVLTPEEAEKLTREAISERWRQLLSGSDIAPISLHSPLWFWSRGNFAYELKH